MANIRDRVLQPLTLDRLLLVSTFLAVVGYLAAKPIMSGGSIPLIFMMLAMLVLFLWRTDFISRLDGRRITVWRSRDENYSTSAALAYVIVAAPFALGGFGVWLERLDSQWVLIGAMPFYCIMTIMLVEDYGTRLDDNAMDRLESCTVRESRS